MLWQVFVHESGTAAGAFHLFRRERVRQCGSPRYRLPIRPGNTGACSAATGEQLHPQFFFEQQPHARLAMDELGQFLLCGYRGSSPAGVKCICGLLLDDLAQCWITRKSK